VFTLLCSDRWEHDGRAGRVVEALWQAPSGPCQRWGRSRRRVEGSVDGGRAGVGAPAAVEDGTLAKSTFGGVAAAREKSLCE
jgi:hypothetical protein